MSDDDKVSIIIKFSILLLIGVVLLSSIAATSSIPKMNKISTSFSEQPNDGDTITLDNHVFEFDDGSGVIGNHIPIIIGLTIVETRRNFRTALAANTDYTVGQ